MRALLIRYDVEDDGRVIAAVDELPGCVVYDGTCDEARRKVVALALRVVADMIEHGEWDEQLPAFRFVETA